MERKKYNINNEEEAEGKSTNVYTQIKYDNLKKILQCKLN